MVHSNKNDGLLLNTDTYLTRLLTTKPSFTKICPWKALLFTFTRSTHCLFPVTSTSVKISVEGQSSKGVPNYLFPLSSYIHWGLAHLELFQHSTKCLLATDYVTHDCGKQSLPCTDLCKCGFSCQKSC